MTENAATEVCVQGLMKYDIVPNYVHHNHVIALLSQSGGVENFSRRDNLLELQEKAQKLWSESRVFEVDAPTEGLGTADEKFFGNFPYPYMNGLLHLGHAFSLSKLEFAAAYHRLCGKRVLFPQGFHCTGMPIKACADKLAREIEMYGNPPVFPQEDEDMTESESNSEDFKADPTKFVAKKSKALAKKGRGTSQWEILKMSGISEDEIPKFADSLHWLDYFPPLAKRDISAMGCGVDWRRRCVFSLDVLMLVGMMNYKIRMVLMQSLMQFYHDRCEPIL